MENGLEIGGLRVQTRFSEGAPSYSDARRDFVSAAGVRPDLILDVQMAGVRTETDEALALIFDSGGVWRLSENERGEQILEVFNQQYGQPQLLAAARYDVGLGKGILEVGTNDYGFGQEHHPLTYPLDELLWIQLLSEHQGFILHAFGVLAASGAVCFSGVSGAGKTTLSGLFAQAFPGKSQLSDDRVIVRNMQGGFQAFGTPWHGDACIWSNEQAKLAHILFIDHATDGKHSLQTLERSEALSLLLVRSFPALYSRRAMEATMDLFLKLVGEVTLHRLSFVPDVSVFPFLESELGIRWGSREK